MVKLTKTNKLYLQINLILLTNQVSMLNVDK